jgi:hypothetical protein
VNLLLDATDLLNIVKRAAVEAVNAGQPSDFCFGKVISVIPLKISIEQKMTLGAAQLILTRNVTDFKTTVTVDWLTGAKSGGSGDSSFASHAHEVSGEREITIHNALRIGERVVLLKQKGGQKYLVLDRVVKT